VNLPRGLVTLMFTDIEGSTRLLTALGDSYAAALARHREIVRAAVAECRGSEVDTQGDAFLVAFSRADDAVGAAVRIQRVHAVERWPGNSRLRIRIGVHTGTPAPTSEGYVGIDLHRGARICSAGHGGQIVASAATVEGLDPAMLAAVGAQVRALGGHRLKDIDDLTTLYDVQIDGLDDRFPPLRTVGGHPNNLPAEPTELIGRRDLLAAARTLMLGGTTRLLTLTGPGGSGKTAAAMRLAVDLLPEFPDGAFAVLLAPILDAEHVAAAVAAELGLREQVGESPEATLRRYLIDRRMLLVLDNLEQVAGAIGAVERLLAAAPGLHVLITSRVNPRSATGTELAVPPLPATIDPAAADPGAAQSPAAELFLRRAATSAPATTFDAVQLRAVQQICERLDGLPLAIELAAARTRLLSPVAMLARLDRPLELAAGGARHAEARQRTLRATLDWSYRLLDDEQRCVFDGFGAFAGSVSVEMAEDVCEASLDDLAELLDHHLVIVDDSGRLQMLETIRAYARERLAVSGRDGPTRDRHASWCRELASRPGPSVMSVAHSELLPTLTAEHDELRAALRWLTISGQRGEALALATDLALLWDTRGLWAEGRSTLERTLADAPDADMRTRAKAQFYIGRMAAEQGDRSPALTALEAAVALFEQLGDVRDCALTLSLIGCENIRPGAEGGRRTCADAVELARSTGDRWAMAATLLNLVATYEEDDIPMARRMMSEVISLTRSIGENILLGIALYNAGAFTLLDGATTEAHALLEEALALCIGADIDTLIPAVRTALGRVAFIEGDVDRSQSLLTDGLERAERMGDIYSRINCLYGLGHIAEQKGRPADAARRRMEAERITTEASVNLLPHERWQDPALHAATAAHG
jgi:predicted ATPase/class 3 adenylate cyclase